MAKAAGISGACFASFGTKQKPLNLHIRSHMKIRFQILAMLAAAALAHPRQSQAGTHYWSGAAGPFFSDAANWSAGGPPTSNEQNITLLFPGNAVKYTCSNNIPGLTVSQLNISG